IDERIEEKTKQLEQLNTTLNSELESSIPFQITELKRQLEELQDTLDANSKAYQKYLTALDEWQRSEQALIGDATKYGSIEHFKHELNYIETQLGEELSVELKKRNDLLKRLFSRKLEILEAFKTFYQPITDFFSTEDDILKTYEIRLDIENRL